MYASHPQREPLIVHDVPERLWQKVGCDIFTLDEKDYLCTVHYYSGYFEIDHLERRTARPIRHLKQQTSPGSRRQPEMGNFFADITAHVQHVVTSRCPKVENAKTWGFTSRREHEYLIFCFDHF